MAGNEFLNDDQDGDDASCYFPTRRMTFVSSAKVEPLKW